MLNFGLFGSCFRFSSSVLVGSNKNWPRNMSFIAYEAAIELRLNTIVRKNGYTNSNFKATVDGIRIEDIYMATQNITEIIQTCLFNFCFD